jgi:hypothetical protein
VRLCGPNVGVEKPTVWKDPDEGWKCDQTVECSKCGDILFNSLADDDATWDRHGRRHYSAPGVTVTDLRCPDGQTPACTRENSVCTFPACASAYKQAMAAYWAEQDEEDEE